VTFLLEEEEIAMRFHCALLSLVVMLKSFTLLGGPPDPVPIPNPRILLAVGAHCGDMEISCGGVLAGFVRQGGRVVLFHLTLGEGGNPRLSPTAYGEQKRREAAAAAKALGAEVIYGPYKDGELPDSEEASRYVADVIRQVKPAILITHWKNSIHKDHIAAFRLVQNAELLAALPAVKTGHEPYSGIRRILLAENWEDKEGFSPYTYIDVSADLETWEKSVKQYEFIRGGISSFPYFEYYKALARVRGAESSFHDAVAFEIDSNSKKEILKALH
jgi:N-acetylglucosamine malate deacetylase 1